MGKHSLKPNSVSGRIGRFIDGRQSSAWSKALSVSWLTSIIWLLVGYAISSSVDIEAHLPEFISQPRLFGLIALLTILPIPALLFIFNKISKQGFLLRKMLPRVVYIREILLLLVTVNTLAYLSPNIAYTLFPILLAAALGWQTIGLALKVAKQPQTRLGLQPISLEHLDKIIQKTTKQDYISKISSDKLLAGKKLKRQSVVFIDYVNDLEVGLNYYMKEGDFGQYQILLNYLIHMSNRVDYAYQLQIARCKQSELEQIYMRLASSDAITDRIRLIIQNQLKGLMSLSDNSKDKNFYKLSKLILNRAYTELFATLQIDGRYNFTRLIRYNDIMIWWLSYIGQNWSENHQFEDSRLKILADLIYHIGSYMEALQYQPKDSFGQDQKIKVLALRVILQKSIIPTLHITTYDLLASGSLRRAVVVEFLEIVVNLQKRLQSKRTTSLEIYTESYVEETISGLILVLYGLKQSSLDFDQDYEKELYDIFFSLDWQSKLCLPVRFYTKHNNSKYDNISRSLIIASLYSQAIASLDLSCLTDHNKSLLQRTDFFSNYIKDDGTNSFLDNLEDSQTFKQHQKCQDLYKFIEKLVEMRINNHTD